jgi:hypothetical protein
MNVPRDAVNALSFLALLALACSGSRRPTRRGRARRIDLGGDDQR